MNYAKLSSLLGLLPKNDLKDGETPDTVVVFSELFHYLYQFGTSEVGGRILDLVFKMFLGKLLWRFCKQLLLGQDEQRASRDKQSAIWMACCILCSVASIIIMLILSSSLQKNSHAKKVGSFFTSTYTCVMSAFCLILTVLWLIKS